MSPQQFKSVWNESEGRLSPISPGRLARFSLSSQTTSFLATSGLPEQASPFLRFVQDSDDSFDGISKLTDNYDFSADDPVYGRYVVIGYCRDGDVIAVDAADQDVIMQLNHGDLFKPMFFNSSIETLADFLILIQEFEASVIAGHGEEGLTNGYFTDQQFDRLRDGMEEIDKRALDEDGFWKEELEIMLDHRKKFMEHGPDWYEKLYNFYK